MALFGPHASRSLIPLLLLSPLIGCGRNPASPESAAPGVPSQIVMTAVSHAGGHERVEETRIDSASQSYTYLVCDDAGIAAPCTNVRVVRAGVVPPNVMRELFTTTTSANFRALSSAYQNPPGVTPPDRGSARLEVVRNGTRRTITWTSAAYLPAALVEFNCRLLSARGDLLLCD